jgi:predicted nucleic-acid-binding protein
VIALDTNVLVRFLVQDDPTQGQAAAELVDGLTEQEPGYICREVIVELVWVLERAYKMTRAQIAPAVEGLLTSREFVVEDGDRVGLGLARYGSGGAGFSDRMILLASVDADCACLATFDKALARDQGVQLLKS